MGNKEIVMPTNVYVINQSGHDFSSANFYGNLIFLSDGKINRLQTNEIYRMFLPELLKSGPEDYLLLTSLTVMNIIAACIMVKLHNKINMLIFNPKNNQYKARTIDFRKVKRI